MKLLMFGAVLCFVFVFVVGESANSTFEEEVKKKEEEANKYCNTLHPVTEDPRKKLALTVIRGDPLPRNLSTIEWCNLQCVLEKLGFYDADGKMQVRKIFQFTIKVLPEISNNSHNFLMHLYQTYRMTKGLEDKCMKAYVAYYRFVEAVMTSTLAVDLNAKTDV